LIYDKRGVGRSTGNRHTAAMADFADDALAGVDLLRSRSDIDAAKIGVYGHSQGGWQAPLAAVRSDGKVAFVITAAGPAKEYRAQTNDEIASALRLAGFNAADVKEALAHQDLYFAVMRHRASWAELEASTVRVSAKPWARFVWKPKTETEVLSDTLEYIDPTPVLSRLRVPILAMYGGNDVRVQGRANAKIMRELLRLAGNGDATIHFFPEADHDFWRAKRPTTRDVRGTTGYVESFFPTVLGWLRAREDGRAPQK
jgi:pimeloyl-ACP methyl ester carboxylesterase